MGVHTISTVVSSEIEFEAAFADSHKTMWAPCSSTSTAILICDATRSLR
jgi:hypothetical protein